jgi:hypothetical protein
MVFRQDTNPSHHSPKRFSTGYVYVEALWVLTGIHTNHDYVSARKLKWQRVNGVP